MLDCLDGGEYQDDWADRDAMSVIRATRVRAVHTCLECAHDQEVDAQYGVSCGHLASGRQNDRYDEVFEERQGLRTQASRQNHER